MLPRGTEPKSDQKLLQAVVRARAWLVDLESARFASIEELANAVKLHPKVVRQALALAFLKPNLIAEILMGQDAGNLPRRLPKRLPLPWANQQQLLR